MWWVEDVEEEFEGRAGGYEYRYGFAVDHTIARNPTKVLRFMTFKLEIPGSEMLRLEIRTQFVAKLIDGEEEVMASERFDVCAIKPVGLEYEIRDRLRNYWISRREISDFVAAALVYADATGAASVIADLKVVTVQREKEGAEAMKRRSIAADKLLPVYVAVDRSTAAKKTGGWPGLLADYWTFCMDSCMVTDVERGLAVMKMCSLCLRGPALGDHVTQLECRHAFHSRCLFDWLLHNELLECPSFYCGRSPPHSPTLEVPDFFVRWAELHT